MTEQQTKPTVSIIGAGRLGTALALALSIVGYRVLSVVARHSESAERAANIIGASVVPLAADEISKLPPSDLVLITVPDDALQSVVRDLSAQVEFTHGAIILHTSGALSSKLLSPLAGVGLHCGSLHPLVSVSEPEQGAKNLRGAFFCVEGDEMARAVATSVIQDLGGQSFSVAQDKKALYHAAAVTTAGHVVALFDVAVEMLVKAGLDTPTARKVLTPLINSAVGNLETASPEQALTGTFSRGDKSTVTEHLKALEQADLPIATEIYRLLGMRSLELAERRGLNSDSVEQIKEMLKQLKPVVAIKG